MRASKIRSATLVKRGVASLAALLALPASAALLGSTAAAAIGTPSGQARGAPPGHGHGGHGPHGHHGHAGGGAQGALHRGAAGTVASVDRSSTAGSCGTAGQAGSFSLTTPDNSTITVDVATSTTFVERGVGTASFADVCVGDFAGAVGPVSSGTVSATKVFVLPPRAVPPGRRAAFGTVASVDGSSLAGSCGTAGQAGSFTLTTRDNTTDTVNVDAPTTFLEPHVQGASFADVCVGDVVGALGPGSGGTVTARRVLVLPARIRPPAPPGSSGAAGTVASVGGSSTPGSCGTAGQAGSFTLTTRDNTTDTVNVDAATTFVAPKASSPSFANVCVGEFVVAVGAVSNGTVTATQVIVPPLLPRRHEVLGTVASVDGSSTTGSCGTAGQPGSFTLTSLRHVTDTVDVDASTTFIERRTSSPSFADVCVGDVVVALGSISDGTVTTTKVIVLPGERVGQRFPLTSSRP